MNKQNKKDIPIFHSDIKIGLTKQQAEERKLAGLNNVSKNPAEKSYFRILCENIFTFFNSVLFAIALIYLFFIIFLCASNHQDVANQYFGITKFFFLIPVIINIVIGTFQEMKAKQIIAKLKLVHETKAIVIREGIQTKIPVSEIVRDDIILLKAGNQAVCDIQIIEGECEVDESMLTGESDSIKKKPGDFIYSGSDILVGGMKGIVLHTGNDTYAATLSSKVKSLKKHQSKLMNDIYTIIKRLTILLAIVCLVVTTTLIYKVIRWGNDPTVFDGMEMSLTNIATWSRILLTTGAFAISLIPTGLVLLASVTLALSIIRLAKQNTMIQELYNLENLSRIDTLCLDKTGTLTDGTMQVCEVKFYQEQSKAALMVQSLLAVQSSSNATAEALLAYFGQAQRPLAGKEIPFSSATKCSGIILADNTKILLGAPEYLLSKDHEAFSFIDKQAQKGNRVLAVTDNGELSAIIVLKDNLRSSAKDTLTYFYENGVDIRIISGDNPLTVSSICRDAGVKGYEKAISLEHVSLDDIPELVQDYIVFARVSPEQKQKIVESLQARNHKVGMTGDGVNDLLALRKADASITFAKASDAAKSVADVVLLDNDFSHLKEVVFQGRRVVNNIERSATLFLMKSLFIFLLSLMLIPMKKGQMWFSIENIYLMEVASIAVGGFLLSLEGSKTPIRGDFLKNVFFKAAISAGFIALGILVPLCLYEFSAGTLINETVFRSMISISTALGGISVIFALCQPFTKYRLTTLFIVLGITILMIFFLPSAFLGGNTLSLSMFQSESGFFHSQFIQECFQPWNSLSVQHTFSNIPALITMSVYVILGCTVYAFLMNRLQKRLSRTL